MPTDETLRDYYSTLDQGRLIQLASELSALTSSAQEVLTAELRRRGLDDQAVRKYEQEPALWEVQSAGLPLTHRVNGCGTTLIGRWDERPDGSYMTEKWVTVLFVPIYRVSTMRIRNGEAGLEILRQ